MKNVHTRTACTLTVVLFLCCPSPENSERASLLLVLGRLASCPIGEPVGIADQCPRLDKALARLHRFSVLFYDEPNGCVQLWSEGSKTAIQRVLLAPRQAGRARAPLTYYA